MRDPDHRSRTSVLRLATITLAAAVAVAGLPSGIAVAQGTVDDRHSPIPDVATEGLAVTAEARTGLHAGGAAVVAGAVFDTDGAAVAAPIVVAVDSDTEGVAIDRLDATAGAPADAAWECDVAASTCTLVSTETAEPMSLAADQFAPWRLVLDVDVDTDTDVTASSLEISTSAGTGSTAASTSTTIEFLDTAALPILATLETPSTITADRSVTATAALTYVGRGSGTAPDLVAIDGLLPPTVTDWSSAGDDWRCLDDSSGPTCTWNGEAPEVGADLPPLTLTGVLDPAVAADSTVEWSSTVTPAGHDPIFDDHTATIAPPPAPSATLSANVVHSVVVVAPASIDLDVDVTAFDLDAETLTVSATLPVGLTLDANRATTPWSCGAVAGEAICTIAAGQFDSADGGARASTLRLPLSIADDTATGLTTIDLSLDVPGELDSHLHDNATAVTLAVAESEQPMLEVLPSVILPDGTVEVVIDGSSPLIRSGESIALTAHNRGSVDIAPDTDVRLDVTTPASLDITWSDEHWTCESAPIGTPPFVLGIETTCTQITAGGVGPDGRLPALVGHVDDVRRNERFGAWPARAGLVDASGAMRDESSLTSSVRVTIERTTPRLSLSADPARLRAGGGTTLALHVENHGDANANDVGVVVSLGRGLHLAGTSSTCAPLRLVESGPLASVVEASVVECTFADSIEAGSTATVHLDVEADDHATSDHRADAIVRSPDTDGAEPVPVTIDIRPPLTAVAEAIPAVAGPAHASITLDARASEGGTASYSWRQVDLDGSAIVEDSVEWIGSPVGRVVQFQRPTVDSDTTLRFELSVSDGAETAIDLIDVVIDARDEADFVETGEPTDGTETRTIAAESAAETTTSELSEPSDGGSASGTAKASTDDHRGERDDLTQMTNVDSALPSTLDVVNGVYEAHERIDHGSGSFSLGGVIVLYDPADADAAAGLGLDLPYATTGSRLERVGQVRWSAGGTWLTTDFDGFFACDAPSVGCVEQTEIAASPPDDRYPYLIVPDDIAPGKILEARFSSHDGATLHGEYIVRVAVMDRVPFPSASEPPTITGDATELGESVSVHEGGWLFETDPTSFAYQWQVCTDEVDLATCSDIPGARSKQFTPTADHAGAWLRARVSATNSVGTSIPLHDPTTAAVPAFSTPVLELAPSTLTAPIAGESTSVVLGTYAPSDATITAYQWRVCSPEGSSCFDVGGATRPTFAPHVSYTDNQIGAEITVEVPAGSINVFTELATVVGAPVANTVPPSVVAPATTSEAQRYTATLGTWTGASPSVTVEYEFRRCAGAATPIESCTIVQEAGASSSYDAVTADIGTHLAVVVTMWNELGPVTSAAGRTVDPVAAPDPVAVATPAISVASPTAGATATVTSTGEWNWAGATFATQWQRCSSPASGCVDLPGQTADDYDLALDDDGSYLRAEISTTNQWGRAAASRSSTVGPVSIDVPINLSEPSLQLPVGATGPHEGMTLSAVAGTWTSPPTDPLVTERTYDWQRCDGDGCTTVATGPTYTVADAIVGDRIRIVEHVATGLGVAESAASVESSAVVDGAPSLATAPTLSSTPLATRQLSVDPGTWTTWTADTPAFSYQWRSCTADLADCVDRSTGTSYTPPVTELGRRLVVAVTASNAYGATTELTAASDPVALGSGPTVSTDAPGGVIGAIGGERVTIIGSASGTGALTTTWTQLSGTSVIDGPISGDELDFVAPDGITESLTFAYRATQPDEQFSEAIVRVDVVVAAAITITAPDGPLVGGEPATVVASGVGPAPHTFLWTQTGGTEVLTSTVAGPRLDITPPPTGADTLQFRVDLVTGDGQTASASADIDYTPPAVAGTDVDGGYLSVGGGETITITGTGTGHDGVTLQWTQIDGPEVVAEPVDDPVLTVTTPPLGRGTLTFRLVVTAGDGRTDSADVVVDYAQPAGLDVIAPTDVVVGGTSVTLDARARGIAPFTYDWQQTAGPAVDIVDATVADLVVATPITGADTLEFALTIETADGQTASATTRIDYTEPARVVSVDASDSDVLTGTTIRLSGTGTALAPSTSHWSQTAGTPVLDGVVDGGAVDVTVPDSGSGTLVFEFEVRGANDLTATDIVVVTYDEPPPTPAPAGLCDVVAAARAPGSTARLGDDITIRFASVALNARACTGDTTATFTGAEIVIGETFIVSDASGSFDRSSFRLTSGTLRVDDEVFGDHRFDLVGDGLSVDFGDDTFAADASFVSPGLALLDAPAGWSAATRLDFTSDDGVATVAIDAVALPGSGASTGTENGLPVVADGAPAVTLSGSWTTGGGLDLDARIDGLVDLGTGPIALTGSVGRAAGDLPLSVEIGAEHPGRIAIADGVELSGIVLAWSDGTVSGSGLVHLAGSTTMAVSMSISSADNWSVTIAGDPAARPWQLVTGLSIDPSRTSGSIERSGSSTTVTVTLGADHWNAVDGVTISDLDLTASAACVDGSSCALAFAVRAGLGIDLDGVAIGGVVDGRIELATGAYDLTVSSLTPFSPFDGVSATDISATIERDASGATSVALDGSASIAGTAGRLVLDIEPRGWVAQLNFDELTPFSGAPTFSDASVLYASGNRTLVIDGEAVSVSARTVTAAGSTTPPAWLTDLFGIPATQVHASGSIDLSTSEFDLALRVASLGGAELVDVAGVSIAVDELDLHLRGRGTRVASDFTAAARLRLPGVAGSSPTEVDVILSAGMNPTTGTLALSASLAPGQRWDDVLGVSGLDVTGLAVSTDISVRSGGSPVIGLAGTASLPGFIADPLGIAPGTPVTLAARLGGPNGCFAFEIGDGDSLAIDVLNAGVIEADYASLVIAPDGCTIGVYDYPTGITVGFDGDVLSVPAVVNVSVQPQTSAMSADIELGRIGLGGLTIDGVDVQFDMSPTSQQIAFGGEVTVFGATARVEGEVIRSATATSTRFSGSFPGPSLGGFGLDDLDVEFESSPQTGELSATGTTAIDLLGNTVDIDLDFGVRNGRITEATGTGSVDIDLAAVSLAGDVTVDMESGYFPKIRFDGSMDALGLALGSATGQVEPDGLHIAARLGIDGLVDARVTGMIAYGFDPSATPSVQAGSSDVADTDVEPGDFRFSAVGAVIGLAGFDMQSRIDISSIRGNTNASIDGSIHLGLGNTDAFVTLAGEFDTGGRLELNGTGTVRLAGFSLADAQFSATRDPLGTDELAMTGTFDVPGFSDIALSGAFQRSPEYGTLFQLAGDADVEIGGFELSDGSFVLYREAAEPGTAASTPESIRARVAGERPLVADGCSDAACAVTAGLVGTARFSAPSIGGVDVTVAVAADGSMSFDARTRLGGPAGELIGSPDVTLHFRSNSDGDAQVEFNAVVDGAFGIPANYSVSGTLHDDGRYAYQGAGSIEISSPTIDIGLIRFRGHAAGDFDVTAHGNGAGAPTVDGSIAVIAEVQEKHVKTNLRWSGWSKIFGVRLAGSVSPLDLSVRIDVSGFGTITLPFRF
jgi:K319L-like, PKD domain